MGCWNETCMFSNLPITNGDDIVLFIVADVHHFFDLPNEEHVITEKSMPISLPIKGKYNDYGGIVIDTNNGNLLQTQLVALESITDLLGLPLLDALKSIHRGGLTYTKGEFKLTNVNYVMIHDNIYNAIIKEYINNPSHTITKESFEDYFKSTQILLKDIPENSLMRKHMLMYLPHMELTHSKFFVTLLEKFMDNPDGIIEPLYEFTILNYQMHRLRKSWHVPYISGTQETAYELHKVLWGSIGNKLEDLIEKYKSQFGEDE